MRIGKQTFLVLLIAFFFCACSGTSAPEESVINTAAAQNTKMNQEDLQQETVDAQDDLVTEERQGASSFLHRLKQGGTVELGDELSGDAEQSAESEAQIGASIRASGGADRPMLEPEESGGAESSGLIGTESSRVNEESEPYEDETEESEQDSSIGDWAAEFKLTDTVQIQRYEMISRQRKLAAVRETVRSGSGSALNSDLKEALVAGMETDITNEIRVSANEAAVSDKAEGTAEVAILLYHNIAEEENGSMTVSVNAFQSHMNAIRSAGYTSISFEELVAFVEEGAQLPEKPVIISFDDGYISNYEIAYPFLSGADMKAVIFPIGVTMGASSYKDTGVSITPHFGAEELRVMADSGVISIQSHTYDMHRTTELDWDYRLGSTRKSGESMEEYEAEFRGDFMRSKELLEQSSGNPVIAYSYPYGLHTENSERWLADMGVKVTVTTDQCKNLVEMGNSDSLKLLGRFTITEEFSKADLLKLLGE